MNRTSTDWIPYRLYGQTLISDFPFAAPLPLSESNTGLRFSVLDPADHVYRPDKTPIYESGKQDDPNSIAVYRKEDLHILRFHPGIDFFVAHDRIDCYLPGTDLGHLLEQHLFGPVMSFWLENHNILALHGSAVVTQSHTLAFLGHNGAGKTSLCTSFLQAGGSLLTDGALAVELAESGVLAHSGYPQLRLWPDHAEYFLGEYEDLEQAHPKYAKRRVELHNTRLGGFCRHSQNLTGIFVIDRDPDCATVDIQRLSPGDAAIELVRYSFIPRLASAAGFQPARLEFMANLTPSVPVYRLRYPHGTEWLPRVRTAILRATD